MPAIVVLPQVSHPILEMNTYEHGERLAGMAELGSPSPASVTSSLCHALPGGGHVLLSYG